MEFPFFPRLKLDHFYSKIFPNVPISLFFNIPIPVFPEVPSIKVVTPGIILPSRSAASIIEIAMRSFTLPAGFIHSILAAIEKGMTLKNIIFVFTNFCVASFGDFVQINHRRISNLKKFLKNLQNN